MPAPLLAAILFVAAGITLVSSLWAEPNSKTDEVLVSGACALGWASIAVTILHSIHVMWPAVGLLAGFACGIAIFSCSYALLNAGDHARYAVCKLFDIPTEQAQAAAA